MHYDVVIIGGGPGGLSCASYLAQHNLKILVVERKSVIGPKACGGGITWSGLLATTPAELIEKTFSKQTIVSSWQTIAISEPYPILATVDRKKLGQWMADTASGQGVDIWLSTSLQKITSNSVILFNGQTKKKIQVEFNYLVGADGSSSSVRKHLKIPTTKIGMGINYQIPGHYEKMEWHLLCRYFKNGYGWIFPHKETVSIGAYQPLGLLSPTELNNRLRDWANSLGFQLDSARCSAGRINYDYRGCCFGNIYLIGDAAGLASALTGEGIFPAILSGRAIAHKIIDPKTDTGDLTRLAAKQRRFEKMVQLTGRNDFFCFLLAETGLLGLRSGIIKFTMLEMGG